MLLSKIKNLPVLAILTVLCLSSEKGFSQNFWGKSHVGVGVGALSYSGDILNPKTKLALQGNYTYELTDHFNVRGQLSFGNIGATDASAPNYSSPANPLYARPHPFKSKIQDVSLLVEYNLLNMNGGSKWTPYIFSGVGFFHYVPYDTRNNTVYYATDKRNKLNIPFGGGIKYGLTDNIRLNLETNIRHATTNDLDGYNPPNEGKDWFYTVTLGVSFRLGGDYSSNKSGGSGKNRTNRKNCPPVYL